MNTKRSLNFENSSMIEEDYGTSEAEATGRLIAMDKKANEFSKSSEGNDDVIGLLDVNLDKDESDRKRIFVNKSKIEEIDFRNKTSSDQQAFQEIAENVPNAKEVLDNMTGTNIKNESAQGFIENAFNNNKTDKIEVLEHRNETNYDSDQLLLHDTRENTQLAAQESASQESALQESAPQTQDHLENTEESEEKIDAPSQVINQTDINELVQNNNTNSDQLLAQNTQVNAQIAKDSLDDVTESDDAINGDSDVYMEHMDREDDFPDVIASEAVSDQNINEETSIEVMKNHTGLPDIPNESFTNAEGKTLTPESDEHHPGADTIGRNRVFAYQNKTKNALNKKDDSYVFTDSQSYSEHDDTNHALENINSTMRLQNEKGYPKLENSSVLSQDFPSYLRNSSGVDEDTMTDKETKNNENTSSAQSVNKNKQTESYNHNYTAFTNSLTDIIMQVLGEDEAKPLRPGIYKKVKEMQEERSSYDAAQKFINDNGTMEDAYPNSPFPENIEESVFQTESTDFDKDAKATVHTNVGDIFVLFHTNNESHTKKPLVENANESLVTVRTKFGTIDFDFHGLHKKDQTSQNRAHIFGTDLKVIPKNFDFKDSTHRYSKRKEAKSHASVLSYNDFKKSGHGKRKKVSEVLENMSSMLQNISKASGHSDKIDKKPGKKAKSDKQRKETKSRFKASPKLNLHDINFVNSLKQIFNAKAKNQNRKTAYQQTKPKSTYRYNPSLLKNRPLPSFGTRFRNSTDWTFPYNFIEHVSKFYDTIEPPPMLVSPSEKTQESIHNMHNVSLNYQGNDPDDDEYNNWGVYNFKQHVSNSGSFMSGPAIIPNAVIPRYG